jgi:hypothetical protein
MAIVVGGTVMASLAIGNYVAKHVGREHTRTILVTILLIVIPVLFAVGALVAGRGTIEVLLSAIVGLGVAALPAVVILTRMQVPED